MAEPTSGDFERKKERSKIIFAENLWFQFYFVKTPCRFRQMAATLTNYNDFQRSVDPLRRHRVAPVPAFVAAHAHPRAARHQTDLPRGPHTLLDRDPGRAEDKSPEAGWDRR